MLGRDGFLYGTTPSGGAQNGGSVFKIGTNGTGFILLYSFSGADGTSPQAPLIQGIDGSLYGTTSSGGTNSAGTIFRLSTDGTDFTVLHTFLTDGVDGQAPTAPVLQGADGMLYGITSKGGAGKNGSVNIFKMGTNGNGYGVINSHAKEPINGNSGLTLGPDGMLYGTGASYIFRLNTNGGAYNLLYYAGGGPYPNGGPLVLGDGSLYGTTSSGGGSYPGGTIFKIRPNGQYTNNIYVHNFDGTNGAQPMAGPIQGADGSLYGTASSSIAWYNQGIFTNGYGCVYSLNTNGGYAIHYMFTGTNGDGQTPLGGLVQGPDGALYGTTSAGGDFGFGTIFKIDLRPGITAQPQNVTVRLGDPATLSATASSSLPLSFQWQFANGDMPGATDASVSFAATTRSNAGPYSLVVSNYYGTAASSNASLVVQVPQLLSSAGVQPDGSFRLTSAYQDAFPLTSNDLSRFTAQSSTDLVQWVSLTNAVALSNGAFIVTDTNTAGVPVRFYRIIQQY
jgi:uncharacterized repeat protein (TIGR03803 family)